MGLGIKLSNRFEEIVLRIDLYLLESMKEKTNRSYLGGSVIGKECDRQLWYEYHQPISNQLPRVERIFHLGHLIESYVIGLLRHAGYKVFSDDDNGQYGFEDEEIAGHIDGVILIGDVPHLLEIKSANDSRFNEMVKKGIQISDKVYYAQVQVYMHYMELEKACFVVMNKNTSEIHSEIIDYDPIEANYLVNRGKEIVRMIDLPDRKYKTKAFFKCNFCNYKDFCWSDE